MSVLPALVAIALGSAPFTGGTPTVEEVKAELFAKRILELTNAERFKLGRPSLKLDPSLTKAASWLAEDMALLGYFDHQDSKQRGPSRRAEEFGYTDWLAVGENIAFGLPTPEQVFRSWQGSTKHRQNMVDPRYKEMGLGLSTALADPTAFIWVQSLGTRKASAIRAGSG